MLRSSTSAGALLLAFLAIGCGHETPPPPTPSAVSPAQPAPDPQSGSSGPTLLAGGRTVDAQICRITLPKGWILKPDPTVGMHAVPQGVDLYPNFKMSALRPPTGADIEKVVEESKKAYAKTWRVEDEAACVLGAQPAHRMVLQQGLAGSESKQLKYFVAAEPRVLIITGQSEPEDFDEYLPLFEAISQSLVIR